MKQIAIVGAGAAGMTAAFFALQKGAYVTLLEKNKQAGRKICITGKGRCNLTNLCDARDFLSNVVNGSKFLSSAIYRFTPQDTMEWFESLGLSLKVERGNRVFPQSERASDVRDVMLTALKKHPRFSLDFRPVTDVIPKENGKIEIALNGRTAAFDAVILATGGKSYPLTGSTGDGYRFAKKLGHTVTDLFPSLVRVVCAEHFCADLQGLSLKNVHLSLLDEGAKKPIYSAQGEMIFTDNGVSGPLVLSASAHLRKTGDFRFEIDFKPALSEEILDKRLLSDFAKATNRCFKNALDHLLPAALRPVFVRLSGIDPEKRVHQISRTERQTLVRLLKSFPLTHLKLGPMEEAIVTSGGVNLSEVDPRTMHSKLVSGLYFAGEILDVDAYTGGYNLQIAFSTGKLAGESAAECVGTLFQNFTK